MAVYSAKTNNRGLCAKEHYFKCHGKPLLQNLKNTDLSIYRLYWLATYIGNGEKVF